MSTLSWWKSRQRREEEEQKRATMSFAEVLPAERRVEPERIEIATVSGVRVFVPSDFDAEALGRVLALLDRRC